MHLQIFSLIVVPGNAVHMCRHVLKIAKLLVCSPIVKTFGGFAALWIALIIISIQVDWA